MSIFVILDLKFSFCVSTVKCRFQGLASCLEGAGAWSLNDKLCQLSLYPLTSFLVHRDELNDFKTLTAWLPGPLVLICYLEG